MSADLFGEDRERSTARTESTRDATARLFGVTESDEFCRLCGVYVPDVHDGLAHHASYAITVNGKQCTVHEGHFVDYGDVVGLSGQPSRDDYTIVVRGANEATPDRTLRPGEIVNIKDGTTFNVALCGDA